MTLLHLPGAALTSARECGLGACLPAMRLLVRCRRLAHPVLSSPSACFLWVAAGTRLHANGCLCCAGCLMPPLQVIRSLWGPDATEEDCAGMLKVSYRRLPKGELVLRWR